MKKIAAFVATLLLASGAQAVGCYTVLNAKGEIVSQTSTPPVDMRYQLHQTVPYKYGQGARLIFGPGDENCGDAADLYDDSWRQKQAQAQAKQAKRKTTAKRKTSKRKTTRRASAAKQAASPAPAAAAAAPAPAAPAAPAQP